MYPTKEQRKLRLETLTKMRNALNKEYHIVCQKLADIENEIILLKKIEEFDKNV